jgi:MFS family permease
MRDVLVPALLSAVGQYIAWATTFGFVPILARNLGATGEVQSLLVSLNIGVGVAGNLLTTALVKRLGTNRLLYISFGLMALGAGCAAAAQSLPLVFLAQILIGVGGGIGYPLCMGMSIQYVDEKERATAMGLHQAVYAIGMFAGPWLSGILAEAYGIPLMFAGTAVAGLGLSIVLGRMLARSREI